jgi:preprotein translocase subunit SecE
LGVRVPPLLPASEWRLPRAKQGVEEKTSRDRARGQKATAKNMAIKPFEFLQQVRSETSKVTWPTRRETILTTIMVFVMATVAAIFFLIADQIIRFGMNFLLNILR